jgi:hypothetical protein
VEGEYKTRIRSEGRVEMNYISTAATQSSLSAKFLAGPCPFPFPIPLPRPLLSAARTRKSVHSDLQISIIHPFLFQPQLPLFSALTPGPATFPSDPPVPPTDLDQGYASNLSSCRPSPLSDQAFARLLTHLSSFDRCHSAPQLCCLFLI